MLEENNCHDCLLQLSLKWQDYIDVELSEFWTTEVVEPNTIPIHNDPLYD